MASRTFMAIVAMLTFFSNFSAEARPTRDREQVTQSTERGTENRLRLWSNRLPPLFGPSEGAMVSAPTRARDCPLGKSGEKYRCHDFVSNRDQTRWVIAFGTEDGYQRIRVLKEQGGRMLPYAMIKIVDRSMNDEVIIQSDEVARYAGIQRNDRGHATNDRVTPDPLGKATEELGRALGTVIPGKGQPPLRLPPIFGR